MGAFRKQIEGRSQRSDPPTSLREAGFKKRRKQERGQPCPRALARFILRFDRPINLGAPTRFTRRAWIRRGLLCGTGLRPHFSPSAVGRSGLLTRGAIQSTLLQPQPVDQFPRRRVSISAPRRAHVRGDACPGCQRVFVGVSIRAPRSRAGRLRSCQPAASQLLITASART